MDGAQELMAIRKVVVLDAPIDEVWEAVATSEGIEAWWMPNTFKPVVGHEFVVRSDEYGESPCKVTELAPPHRLGFDWAKDWHLTFELNELEDGSTEFTLTHSGWDADKVTEFNESHGEVRDIMDGGWTRIVHEDLPAYVEG